MVFGLYKIQLLLILAVSILIGTGQHYLTGYPISLPAVLNHFFTLVLGAAIFSALIIGILWYLGKKINARKIFYTYLISWVAIIIFSTISILKVYH